MRFLANERQNREPDQLDYDIFDVVYHLNQSASLISDNVDKVREERQTFLSFPFLFFFQVLLELKYFYQHMSSSHRG